MEKSESIEDIEKQFGTVIDLQKTLANAEEYYQKIFLEKVTEIEELINNKTGNKLIPEINIILLTDWKMALRNAMHSENKNKLLEFGISDISTIPETNTTRFLAHTMLREILFQSSNTKGTFLAEVSDAGKELPTLLTKGIQEVSTMFGLTASFCIDKGFSEWTGDWENHVVIFSKVR